MIPEPGSCSSEAASQARRSAWRFSRSALEGEAVATERAAERGELGAELFADVGDDAVVGGGGAAEHRHGGGVEAVDDLADPPVVGPEVVTPVGDAVDLVDDHQPGSGTDQRHRQIGELRIGEPFGRDEDEVDVVRRDVGGELVDRRRRRAVHRHRAQPEPGRGVDLVAHQREQRRDEQRRPEPGVAQQPRGEEVDRALAPSGALDDEDTGPVADERLDRFTLMWSELRVGSPGQPTQGVEQFVGLTRRTHSRPLCRRGVSTAPGDEQTACRRSAWTPPHGERISAVSRYRLPPAFHPSASRRPPSSHVSRHRAEALPDGIPAPAGHGSHIHQVIDPVTRCAPPRSRSVGERAQTWRHHAAGGSAR